MSLRDTLIAAQKRMPVALTPEELRSEWLAALHTLEENVKQWLSEYVLDGLISIRKSKIVMNEEGVGFIETYRLNIEFGPSTIIVSPVGRLVVGSVGRVDMYRKDISSEPDRFMILRVIDQDDTPKWQIQKPNSLSPNRSWIVREFIDLDKQAFEAAFDALARRR